MSGVAVDSDVINHYNQLSFGKNRAKYFVVKLSADLSKMVMDHTSSTTASWEDMSAALPKNECRYVFFHFEYEEEGGKRAKIVLVKWCPEPATTKEKMIFSSTPFKKYFDGINCTLQATGASEVSREELMSHLTRI